MKINEIKIPKMGGSSQRKNFISSTIISCTFPPSCAVFLHDINYFLSSTFLCPSLFTRLSLLVCRFLGDHPPNGGEWKALGCSQFHTESPVPGLQMQSFWGNCEIKGVKKHYRGSHINEVLHLILELSFFF